MQVQVKDSKTRALRDYLRSPFTEAFIQQVKEELKHQIEGTATRPKSMPRPHPYHTYLGAHQGELENLSFVERVGSSALIIGSRSTHASILESGKSASGKFQIFRGYYPNARILRKILQKTMPTPKRLGAVQRAKRDMVREDVINNLMDAYGAKRYEQLGVRGARARAFKFKREFRAAADPDNFARRFGIDTTKNYGYRFGIFTILTRHTKAVKPYMVFSQTAEWTERKMVEAVADRVFEIDRYV